MADLYRLEKQMEEISIRQEALFCRVPDCPICKKYKKHIKELNK